MISDIYQFLKWNRNQTESDGFVSLHDESDRNKQYYEFSNITELVSNNVNQLFLWKFEF
jgi:hypothetical protein